MDRKTRNSGRLFELEMLEPRVLLSGATAATTLLPAVASATTAITDQGSSQPANSTTISYDPAAQVNDIFQGASQPAPPPEPFAGAMRLAVNVRNEQQPQQDDPWDQPHRPASKTMTRERLLRMPPRVCLRSFNKAHCSIRAGDIPVGRRRFGVNPVPGNGARLRWNARLPVRILGRTC